METVTLKNGSTEAKVAVAAIRLSLQALLAEHPIAFYEAAQLARNPEHSLFGNAGEKLASYGLLESGRMHETIRNVIVSAVEGDGFDMRLVSPVAA